MYDLSQQRIIAHELARSGGHVAAAVKRLREEYETFRKLNERTLRRYSRLPGFAEMVAEQGLLVAEAQTKALVETERNRARREAEGTLLDRLAHDEVILDQARVRLEAVLKDPTKVTAGQAILAFDSLARIIDRRREKAMPAIGEFWQAQALVESVSEVLQAELKDRYRAVLSRVKDRYLEKCQAHQDAPAPGAAVEPQTSNPKPETEAEAVHA